MKTSPVSRFGKLLGCGLLIGFLPHTATPQVLQETDMIASAQRALQTYATKVVNADNYNKYGFRSLDEARRARLGDPLQIALIPLTDLKAYRGGTNVRQLLKDAEAVWFPVIVDNEVRAKLEMVRRGSSWTAGEFGGAKTAATFGRATADLNEKLEASNIAQPQTLSLVRVPALNVAFLFVESPSGEFLLAATAGTQKFGLDDNTVYRAEEAMLRLSEFAQSVDPSKVAD